MNTPSLTPPPPQVFPPPPVAHITVVVPSNQEHLQIINKLATFVARHGIQFEVRSSDSCFNFFRE